MLAHIGFIGRRSKRIAPCPLSRKPHRVERMDVHNPLIPTGYDIAWSSVAVLTLGLLIAAMVSLVRAARRLTGTQALLWTVIILFVPVVGPLCWMLIGRRAADTQSGSA